MLRFLRLRLWGISTPPRAARPSWLAGRPAAAAPAAQRGRGSPALAQASLELSFLGQGWMVLWEIPTLRSILTENIGFEQQQLAWFNSLPAATESHIFVCVPPNIICFVVIGVCSFTLNGDARIWQPTISRAIFHTIYPTWFHLSLSTFNISMQQSQPQFTVSTNACSIWKPRFTFRVILKHTPPFQTHLSGTEERTQQDLLYSKKTL